jgi:hypothetical protein
MRLKLNYKISNEKLYKFVLLLLFMGKVNNLSRSLFKWATTLESEKKINSQRRKFLKRGLKALVAGVFLGEAGIHINYYLGSHLDEYSKKNFKELYDVDLYIFDEDAKNSPSGLVMMSEALYLHKILNEGTDFEGLKSIVIDNKRFYNRTLRGQLRYLHSQELMGGEEVLRSGSGKLVLQNPIYRGIQQVLDFHHEYGLFRGNQIVNKKLDFEKEWRKFSLDINGKSFYGRGYDFNSFRYNGFISDFAQVSFNRDLAEMFVMSICQPDQFVWPLIRENNNNLKGKVEIGISYGFLPKYLDEFIFLIDCHNEYFNGKIENFQMFLDKSETFLKNYPDNIYSARVNNFIGDIFISKLDNLNNKGLITSIYDNAAKYYINSLNSRLKDKNSYDYSLLKLVELNKSFGFLDIADGFEKARLLFNKALNEEGDILLPINGVNQYLSDKKLI